MKSPLSTVFLVAMLTTAPAAFARDVSVVFADGYTDTQKQDVMTVLGEHLMQTLEAGDTLTALIGTQTLEAATIPDDEAHRDVARFRSQALMPVWTTVSAFMRQSPPAMDGGGRIDLPGVLERLHYGSGEDHQVILLASPLLDAMNAPQWSMEQSWPNDAVFGLSRAESPYGTADAPDLSGVTVHFCTVTDTPYAGLTHKRMVERSIALLIEGYGANLASFTDDLALCIERAATGDVEGAPEYSRDPSVQTPEMLSAGSTLTSALSLPTEQVDLIDALGDPALQLAVTEVLALRTDVRLMKVWLSDSHDEDADRVSVLAPGLSFEMELSHQEQEVVVPVVDGTITIKALADGGGGGVTLSVRTVDDVVHSPILAVDETFEIATSSF